MEVAKGSGVEVRDLTLRYGTTTAIDGLSMTFGPGRIHGLLGRNGSGKTSLLSVIAGFRRATEGEVLIDGEPAFENATAMSRTCLIRGSGDSVEHDWPSDRLVDALRAAAFLRPTWDQDLADRLVERFRLTPKQRLSALSTGQRSAVGVVLGLASRAPITLLDESYLGMDAPSRYAFYEELLSDFMDHPRTVVLSTHLIDEVAPLFEHVAIIDRGRLLLQDDADAIRSRGATLTGPAERVDALVDGLTVLSAQRLGGTKAVTIFGDLPDELDVRARHLDVEVAPAPLQDLFVHLTRTTEAAS
jgi:ABC-2 type transport system ATP-binding protein